MKYITNETFKKEVLEHKGVTVVDMYADWCGPCKMLTPIFSKLDEENTDKYVQYVKVDIDKNQELAATYNVMSIPTVLFFKDGKLINKKVGLMSKDDYKKTVDDAKKFDANAPKKVTVFSTPTCPYCVMVKNYLKDKNIVFEDIDVSKNETEAMKMVQASGQMGVPQIWIGNQIIVGFDKTSLDQAFSN